MRRGRRPTIQLPAALLWGALCSGCGTFIAYPGPERPDVEVATLSCYWRYDFVYIEECHVSAVDGRRPDLSDFANLTTKLAPRRHWIEFGIEHYFGRVLLCRQTADCVPHPDIVCAPQEGYPFGKCVFRK